MSVDPLSMKSVLDRVELLEKSYQEERLAVRHFANACPVGARLSLKPNCPRPDPTFCPARSG